MECEVQVDRIHLEHVLEYKYLGCVLGKSAESGAECSRKVASGRRVAGAIKFLVNAWDLQLECPRVLYETCFYLLLCVPVRQCYERRRYLK